ncbi:hypothetical protein BAUCODRAFT_118870 [Baudoinia panamericana UAMH 10762]|uniref:Polyprenal reductase n=1 Tax=Baudoinia panamericana (strain UAMH 10762) TaxID=717646 RepID=M2NQ57_BAUPA|nr:uncharacterized protein BAUCODRAFT_118870 [Baudoinia panamericana UAMH 10762]EMD01161.1 hypothetical protein BAUCODRAFT_118870 [Baudoinia panamericana UAMH 10762]
MDVIHLLRIEFVASAALVLLVYAVSALKNRFLAYGARSSPSRSDNRPQRQKVQRPKGNTLTIALDRLADFRVPHSWFTTFYVTSVSCLLFWLIQLLLRGPNFRAVATRTSPPQYSMTFRQVLVTWALMLVQSSRRLYECLQFARPSTSKMWIGHWLLGIGFYGAMSIAVWVEGIPAIQNYTFSWNDLPITMPNLRTFIAGLIFILASGFQHDCHAYLASLKPRSKASAADGKSDYQLPEHPAFSRLIAPHYTAECLIYVALALIATPQGAWLNWTITSALLFVVINLGVTADGTKKWYETKFGPAAVAGKWRMIPLIF